MSKLNLLIQGSGLLEQAMFAYTFNDFGFFKNTEELAPTIHPTFYAFLAINTLKKLPMIGEFYSNYLEQIAAAAEGDKPAIRREFFGNVARELVNTSIIATAIAGPLFYEEIQAATSWLFVAFLLGNGGIEILKEMSHWYNSQSNETEENSLIGKLVKVLKLLDPFILTAAVATTLTPQLQGTTTAAVGAKFGAVYLSTTLATNTASFFSQFNPVKKAFENLQQKVKEYVYGDEGKSLNSPQV